MVAKKEYWTIYQTFYTKKDAVEYIKDGGQQDVYITLPNGKEGLFKKSKGGAMK